MDSRTQQEFAAIKIDVQGVIDELHSLADSVRSNFCGIGNEKCAVSLQKAADHYKVVKRNLNKIDTSAVTEEFAKAQRAKANAASSVGQTGSQISKTSQSKSFNPVKTVSQSQVEASVTQLVSDTKSRLKEAMQWLFG